MPLPQLSREQRIAALEKAAQQRRARAQLKGQLKSGQTSLDKILHEADRDETVGRLRVLAVLQSMPGIGKIKASQIMAKLKIPERRRLGGLGAQQRRALLEEFGLGELRGEESACPAPKPRARVADSAPPETIAAIGPRSAR